MRIFIVSLLFLAFGSFAYAESEDNKWEYDRYTDEMRGESRVTATLKSENTVEFDPPYAGGSYLMLGVRKKNEKLKDVLFVISKGQFFCGFTGCKGSVKFGDGKVTSIKLLPSEDHDSSIIFVDDHKKFFSNLKNSEHLIVELPFFRSGNHQFKFNLKGLEF